MSTIVLLTKPIRRKIKCRTSHGISDELIVELKPGGILEIREPRRESERLLIDVAAEYERAITKRAGVSAGRKR